MADTASGIFTPVTPDNRLNAVIQQLIDEQSEPPIQQRREQPRIPLGRKILVEPYVEGWGGLTTEEMQPITAYAKDICARGIGFFHCRSIATRHVVCRMRSRDGTEIALLALLRWCHAIDNQWFLSGGTFVGMSGEEDGTHSG